MHHFLFKVDSPFVRSRTGTINIAGGTYVFPSEKTGEPLSPASLLTAMRRLGIDREESTVHGFRASARTIMEEVLGFTKSHLEHQLSHKVVDPNDGAYRRTSYLKERRVLMQKWADYCDEIKGNVT